MRGPETVDLASVSDPVLVREDGSYLYTLPSVVDDIELRHLACHPRRRSRHQYRRADRAVQGARRRAAGLRPPQSADHGVGRGAVEAQRRAVDRQPCRIRHRADGGGFAGGADRHVGKRRRRCRRWKTLPRASNLPAPRNRRRSSIRPNSPCSTATLIHHMPFAEAQRPAGGARRAGRQGRSRSGWQCAAISTRSPTLHDWWRIVSVGPDRPCRIVGRGPRLRARRL